jgi:hypothetical protein
MRTAVRTLGTRCCLRYAMNALKETSTSAFAGRFEEFKARDNMPGLNRDAVRAWEAGKTAMSPGLAKRIDRRAQGTELIFSATTTLLKEQRLSGPKACESVRALWEQTKRDRQWKLPSTDACDSSSGAWLKYAWDNSAALVTRGDFHGFLAILALLRESVAIGNLDCVRRYALDLYTILPSICRIAWVRRDIDLLLQCVEDMMVGIRWILARVTIDWDAFREQMSNPKPWQDVPPWIIRDIGDFGEASSYQRPAPLLNGMEPLWQYVRCPTQCEIRRSRRQHSFRSMLADG